MDNPKFGKIPDQLPAVLSSSTVNKEVLLSVGQKECIGAKIQHLPDLIPVLCLPMFHGGIMSKVSIIFKTMCTGSKTRFI